MKRALVIASLVLVACDVPEDQELALGAQAAGEIEAEVPLLDDPLVTSYIAGLGQDIASHTSRADLDWQFRVVDSPQINAFALPGGFIYVNRGLIEAARTESELAGVIGHEIGHVVQRHSIEQMQKYAGAGFGVAVLCAVTSVCESEAGQLAVQAGGTFVLARYSRKDEFEADSEAVINVFRAGYDPEGVPRFFERILELREQRPGILENWFASHPVEETRIRATRALIERIPPEERGGLVIDTREFEAVRARLRSLPPSPEPPRVREEVVSPLP
jgi:beta-barrel assembly-enhancing protease